MLVFITSVRHPRNAHSFETVTRMLNHTLASVASQSVQSFEVIVVCNRGSLPKTHPRVHYHEVDFPAPSARKEPRTGMAAIRADRGAKYASGLLFARQFNPSHIMFFDADDLVSCRLAGEVDSDPNCWGWFFNQGYWLKFGEATLGLVSNFQNVCGTSHIVKYDLYDLPGTIGSDSSYEKITNAISTRYLHIVLGSHRFTVGHFRDQGKSLNHLAYPGAIWVLGHGENHSGRTGGSGLIPVDAGMRNEFHIPDQYTSGNS